MSDKKQTFDGVGKEVKIGECVFVIEDGPGDRPISEIMVDLKAKQKVIETTMLDLKKEIEECANERKALITTIRMLEKLYS